MAGVSVAADVSDISATPVAMDAESEAATDKAHGKMSSPRGLKRRLSCSPSGRPVATPQIAPSGRQEATPDNADQCQECCPELDVQVPPSLPRGAKRTDYLSWDDYFMAVAHLSAMRSKDPSTQVGACIVNAQNRIVGIGYNGFPAGCSDDDLPWDRVAANPLDTKYMYVCHAEMNAILNRNTSDTRGCRIYVDLFPCNECAKLIIQSGINEVVYMADKYHDLPAFVASRRLFNCSGVKFRQHKSSKKITIDLGALP
jgi:dCMP deaminase